MARILVTDGQERAALAIVRSLGQAGHDVAVCSASAQSLAGASRWCSREFSVTDPTNRPAQFHEDLLCVVERWNADVLLPVSEPALVAVLSRRDAFSGTRVPFPSFDAFQRISDKDLVREASERLDIAVPRSTVVRTPAECGSLEWDRYPAVIKTTKSVRVHARGLQRFGVAYPEDHASLHRVLADLPDYAFPVLIQERIVGPGIGVFLLHWDGKVIAHFGHRRIREKPPWGGVSVLRESVPVDPSLLDRSNALLRAFEWNGVAMVEFKLDRESGTPYIMEVNGRFWGSLQLAVDAGVDFPRMLVDLDKGSPVATVAEYDEGLRLRWLLGDFDSLVTSFRHADHSVLSASQSTGTKRLLDFAAAFGPRNRNEVLRWEDPNPFISEFSAWVSRAVD